MKDKKYSKLAIVGFVLSAAPIAIFLCFLLIGLLFRSTSFFNSTALNTFFLFLIIAFFFMAIVGLVLNTIAMFRFKQNHKGKFLSPLGVVFSIIIIFYIIGMQQDGGLIEPSRFLPIACRTPSGIGCVDYFAFQDGTVKFSLRNNLGEDITEGTLSMDGKCNMNISNWKAVEGIDFTCQVEPGDTPFVQEFDLYYKTVSGIEKTEILTLKIDKRLP